MYQLQIFYSMTKKNKNRRLLPKLGALIQYATCVHTQLLAKPMRCILKIHLLLSQTILYTVLCIPGIPSLLHVGRYIFTDHEMTYWKFLNLRVIPVDGHAVFKPLDWLVVWIGGFTLQHQCPCLALSLVLQFLKELDISCNKYAKFKACTAIFYQFPQPFRQPSKFLWCYTKQFYKWQN